MSDNDIENPHANYNPKPVNDGHKPTPKGVMGRVQEGVQSWKENSDFRMRICTTCPHYKAPRCELCGCFMIAKTKIPQARCPAGKW